jgi:RHS repeat-associated protein
MIRHTNRVGLSFYYEYDKSGDDWRVIHSWGDGGLYDYHFAYWLDIQETRITDSLGHVTTVKCNEMGLPIMEIDPLGGRTIFEYDEVGRTTAAVNPANHRIEYTYDDRGNQLKFIRPDGTAVTMEVNTDNKPVAITDPNGTVWRQEWDERGLMRSQTRPLGGITRYHYDQTGLAIRQTDAYGASTHLSFDAYGAVATITDAQGNTTHLQHDTLGNLLTHTDPLGRTARYDYDPKSRLLQASLPGEREIHCAYDAENNLVDYEDEQGVHTAFEYCGLGMLAKRRQAGGATVEHHYDTEERLIGVINQRGERQTFRRDALGRVVEEVDYWGQSTNYRFDTAGHLKQKTDPLGEVTDYATDKLGHILSKSFAHPEQLGKPFEERFEYDANGNLTGCVNEHGRIERRFDPENRLLEEKQAGFVIRNAYDKLGRRIRRETSNGHVVAYEYDPLSRPVSIRIDDEPPITLQRNTIGQITQEQLSPALERHSRYDDAGHLTAQGVRSETDWLFQTEYTYDSVGNLLQRKDSQQGIDRYRYDPLGQIVAHIDPQERLKEYLQDPMGDRLATQIVETPVRQVVGGEQIGGEWYREGYYEGVYYRFDRAGNLRQKRNQGVMGRDGVPPKAIHLAWDANQRLARSERNGVETHYGYDPLGRRLFKRTGTKQTWFGWDGDSLIAEGDGSPTDSKPSEQSTTQPEKRAVGSQREYLYYPGSFEPLAMIEADVSFRYQSEPNGCPTRLMRTNGAIVWSARYQVCGEADTQIETVGNRLRLQGQYQDDETGLYYNRYRYYDPGAGQFVSKDPIGLLGGINNYQYAPNGLGWIDPYGLVCVKVKDHQLPDGRIVQRKYVQSEDDLLELAEGIAKKKSKVDLDDFIVRKKSSDGTTFYRSPDGRTEIEWSPRGHPTVNEGPHLAIKNIDPVTGKAVVEDKYFIEHWDNYTPSPEYWNK